MVAVPGPNRNGSPVTVRYTRELAMLNIQQRVVQGVGIDEHHEPPHARWVEDVAVVERIIWNVLPVGKEPPISSRRLPDIIPAIPDGPVFLEEAEPKAVNDPRVETEVVVAVHVICRCPVTKNIGSLRVHAYRVTDFGKVLFCCKPVELENHEIAPWPENHDPLDLLRAVCIGHVLYDTRIETERLECAGIMQPVIVGPKYPAEGIGIEDGPGRSFGHHREEIGDRAL